MTLVALGVVTVVASIAGAGSEIAVPSTVWVALNAATADGVVVGDAAALVVGREVLCVWRADSALIPVSGETLLADALLSVPNFVFRALNAGAVDAVEVLLADTLVAGSAPLLIFGADRGVDHTLATLHSESTAAKETIDAADHSACLLAVKRGDAGGGAVTAHTAKEADVVEAAALIEELAVLDPFEADELVGQVRVILGGVESLEGQGWAVGPPVVGNVQSIEGSAHVSTHTQRQHSGVGVDVGTDELQLEGVVGGGSCSSKLRH